MSSLFSDPLAKIGLYVPPSKRYQFYALLGCWTAAIVFLICAWAKVPGVTAADNATYGKAQQDKLKMFMTFQGWVNLFTALTFLLLLMIVFSVA